MSCNQCVGIEEEFDSGVARRQLRRYRKRGPKRTTRWLIDAIRNRRLEEPSVLDIGGGVGEVQHELVAAGASRVTGIDASSAYLEQCRLEAERRGYDGRATHLHGDFTALHAEVDPADIVTLDRVICCFDDVEALVGRSLSKARRLYGLVYPREAWWTAFGFRVINFMQRLRRADFQVFLHSTQRVESIIGDSGFNRIFLRTSFLWQVALFEAG